MQFNDLAFNQDFSCLLMSNAHGHKIFNCDPFGEFYALAHGKDNNGPTAALRMLFSTFLTIIVPDSGHENSNKVLKIFNLKQSLKICELTFPAGIKDLMLNRKRLVVFLVLGQIYIYSLSSISLLKVLEINAEPMEDCHTVAADLSADDKSYLVLPLLMINDHTDLFNATGLDTSEVADGSLSSLIEFTRKNKQGSLAKKDDITLEDLRRESHGWLLVYDTMRLRPCLLYEAHDSGIAKVAISRSGTKIASASHKGTLLRVAHLNDTADGNKVGITRITSLRRGHHPLRINALKFNVDASVLGCGSESNTIHLFHTRPLSEESGGSGAGGFGTNSGNEQGVSEDEDDYDGSRSSSLENLNENLANLLILKQPSHTPLETHEGKSYFSLVKEKSGKLLNSPYTQLIIKKLPYREYFDNLILEPPRRSFAFIRLPESFATPVQRKWRNVEIGFTTSGVLLLASYHTGNFYLYKVPKAREDDRTECTLVSTHTLCD